MPARRTTLRPIHTVVALLLIITIAPTFLQAADQSPAGAPLAATDEVALSVDASAVVRTISPNIYGMNYPDPGLARELALPLQRWGGNATSRYNYLADISNRGSDWYFQNVAQSNPMPAGLPHGSSADRFVADGYAAGTSSLVSVPMLGWVARPDSPRAHPLFCGFSTARYGAQSSVDYWSSHCGNGWRTDGAAVTGNDPRDTSIPVDEGFSAAWVRHLSDSFGPALIGPVRYYNLDNEPSLWHSTHRDVRPAPLGYAELRDRSVVTAAAIKAVDPSARVLGPAEWGWVAYFSSARDSESGGQNPDRAQYGLPLVPWYLEQMRAAETQYGRRLLDYLDLHYYPQAQGVAIGAAGDAATQQRRLRSTRSLWDPAYSDESWIAQSAEGPVVRLIPRMRAWVDAHYPGTKLAIGEYNWGGLEHINGALAQADVLGIFGREGLDLATIWAPPQPSDPGAFAFRMYLSYDGARARFGEQSVAATSADESRLAVYAARRGTDGTLTVMVVNKSDVALSGPISLSGFAPSGPAQVYTYSEADLSTIVRGADLPAGPSVAASFPARSITLLAIPGPGRPELPEKVYLPALPMGPTL